MGFCKYTCEREWNTGYNWECPDLFELQGKYVLMVSTEHIKTRGNDFNSTHSSIYFIGDLDINKGIFKFDIDGYQQIDYGFDFYAPQTTSDKLGRRLMVAWMDMWGSYANTGKRP